MHRNEIVERRIVIGGYETRCLETAGSGTALLFLHGFADTADTWRHVLTELAQAGRRAVALDLPGLGQASNPDRSSGYLPPLDHFVAAAVEYFTEFGVAPVVVGNSLGAVLALEAGNSPRTTPSGVVLISPAGFQTARWVPALARTRGLEYYLFGTVIPMPVFRLMLKLALPRLLAGDPRRLRPGETARFATQFSTRDDIRRIFAGVPILLPEVRTRLAVINPVAAPTLLLWGSLDRVTLVSGARGFEKAYRGDAIEVLEGLGHCPQLEAPELIATRLQCFVASIEDGQQPQACEA